MNGRMRGMSWSRKRRRRRNAVCGADAAIALTSQDRANKSASAATGGGGRRGKKDARPTKAGLALVLSKFRQAASSSVKLGRGRARRTSTADYFFLAAFFLAFFLPAFFAARFLAMTTTSNKGREIWRVTRHVGVAVITRGGTSAVIIVTLIGRHCNKS